MRAGVKMDTTAVTLWVVAIVIFFVSLLWFLFGTTAFFQRGIDLETTVWYGFFWVPVLIFTIAIILVLVLKQQWLLNIANTISAQRLLALMLIPVALLSAVFSYHQTPTAGWLTERVKGDVIQLTADGKYEYRVEVVNQFQKNAYVRLYLKSMSTGNIAIIRLSAQMEEISARTVPEQNIPKRPIWSSMDYADSSEGYILSVTKEFLTTAPKFEINTATETSNRIE